MRKYADGLVFDTDESEGWVISQSHDAITGGERGRTTLWRTPDGEWVKESTYGSTHSFTRLAASEAAEEFSGEGADLPDQLVSDIEGG